MIALSLTSVNFKSVGGSVSKGETRHIPSFRLSLTSQQSELFFSHFYTSLVRDVDRGVGGWAVPSSGNSIDCDGVVSTRLQTSDGGGGLSAWECELLRSLATYKDSEERQSVKLRRWLRFRGNL